MKAFAEGNAVKVHQVMAVCLGAMLSALCWGRAPVPAGASPGKNGATPASRSAAKEDEKVLFEDPLAGDWQERWFLDGKKATLEHRDGGLYFASGPLTKRDDPVEYHAHHAVLWTKPVFEGDIRISYDFAKIESKGTFLLYIQAQGIGLPPYVEDIYAWRDLREIPAMNKYYKYMSLLSLSFRENIRCKRYPWMDVKKGIQFEDVLFEPMIEYDQMPAGKTYRIDVEKRKASLTLRVQEAGNPKNSIEHTWDTSKNPQEQQPRFVEKGRIGLRQMGGSRAIYRNFVVRRL